MSRRTDAMKKVAVALGYGSASDYTGETAVDVLKELAVVLECAPSVDNIRENTIDEVLDFIAENKGSEEKEPYDLTLSNTHATVTFKRNNKVVTPAADLLYNGDKLKVTAAADEGYDLDTLTLNGEEIESGDVYIVNGHNVAVVAEGTIKQFGLERTETDCTVTVTKGGVAVEDGETALSYGDEITISATAGAEKQMSSLKVNGEDFVSGETLTAIGDVVIVAVAE